MTEQLREGGRAGGFDWASERLLHASRPHRARRLEHRERAVEAATAAAFLAAAGGLALLAPADRGLSPTTALACLVGYALASRVRLFVGAGYAMPTQLVLVPMLLWLPPALVPLLVATALAAGALWDAARGRAHPEQVLTGVANAWYAVGAAAVLVLAGEPGASAVSWWVIGAALAAQCAVDLLTSAAREWGGRGIPPAAQLRVIAAVYLVDVCLTPAAVLLAGRDATQWSTAAAVALLLAFLAGLATDRRARIEDLTSRLDELREERRRNDASIRRVAEVYGSGLDRAALVDLLLATAVDALRADGGRARARGAHAESAARLEEPDVAGALAEAESLALRERRGAVAARGNGFAVAHPLSAPQPGPFPADDMVAVARAGAPFGPDEQALLGHLAAQMTVALDNVAMHERLEREARIDELTGLANHRSFQERLEVEVERQRRFRGSIALAMVDIDEFKAVNDSHGHQQGDEVLRQVAVAIRGVCRAVDLPARYGGEEMAVVMPGTDLDGAFTAGEHIRRAIAGQAVALPGGARLGVTVSVGVAATGPEGGTKEDLIAAADDALYEAKRTGRNRTVRGRAATERSRFARPPRT